MTKNEQESNWTAGLRRIRTLGKTENYKYLGILEADTTKQVELKETNLKQTIIGKVKYFSKPNSIA